MPLHQCVRWIVNPAAILEAPVKDGLHRSGEHRKDRTVPAENKYAFERHAIKINDYLKCKKNKTESKKGGGRVC